MNIVRLSSPADEELHTFHMWLCASEDRGSKRYWKQRFLMKSVPIVEILKDLIPLLDTARIEVGTWSSGDMEVAGSIGQ